ncbi:MAG: TetR/AcrR family transcriptional regulator [Thermodesulfobacteriota bacterium]
MTTKPKKRKITLVPEKIKQRLYPAVLDQFTRNDFHQVNIRNISRASGVSTGTIYKYFRSKEELILDILEEKIEELKQLTDFHLQGLDSTREKFRKAFWVVMDYYERNPGLAITFFITVPTRTWMQRESYARYDVHEMVSSIASVGRQRKEIDPMLDDAQITGLFFMHCYREVTIWYYRKMAWKLTDTIDIFFPLFWKTVSLCG